jgi:hypothetical protein
LSFPLLLDAGEPPAMERGTSISIQQGKNGHAPAIGGSSNGPAVGKRQPSISRGKDKHPAMKQGTSVEQWREVQTSSSAGRDGHAVVEGGLAISNAWMNTHAATEEGTSIQQ